MKDINYKGFEIRFNGYDNEATIKQLFDTFLDSQKNQSFENIERFYYENGKFYTVHKKHPVYKTTPNLSNRIANFDKDDAEGSGDIDIDGLVDKALEDGYTFEYADTLPALRYNVKNWIEEYLDDNDIDYKLTKKDIKLINSLVKDFYDDNVDEGYHRRKSYSIQEALRELKGSKKIIEKVEDSEAEFPDSFEDIVDFLKADEEEAIKGYEKALDKVEDEFVKDQLDKINTEEKAHKAYLDKVVEDPTVEYTEPLEDEDDADESVTEENVEKNTIEEALKELRNCKKNTNEGIRDFEDKDAEEEYFRHIQELSTDYEDPNAEEYDEDEYDEDEEEDIEESLKEDTKFVTAATILKKEQNSIFAQPTEEGMRKMVLSILDKNKDKMKPENYNKVVRTMRNCPKSAVPSTVWTMLNPSQKVGK